VLALNKREALVESVASRSVSNAALPLRTWRCRVPSETCKIEPAGNEGLGCAADVEGRRCSDALPIPSSPTSEIDPFYLFACHIEWEQHEDPSAGWELIAAAQSSHSETRAQARALLSSSCHIASLGSSTTSDFNHSQRRPFVETEMNTPYGLEIIDNCTECPYITPGSFCALSHPVLSALNEVSHKSTLPEGVVLFVEGQAPRGMFMLCSGKVNLSTTSREGKILILKTALPGEALGLSATISGMGYEMTAETATPCQLNFIDRKHFLELLEAHGETGVHAAQALSRDYRLAYRDIHDLVLTRSSAGKLARLLLAQSEAHDVEGKVRVPPIMTHEEMAHRIGASRETVTRLLSNLRRKHLIRLDGPNWVIRDRTALEALTV